MIGMGKIPFLLNEKSARMFPRWGIRPRLFSPARVEWQGYGVKGRENLHTSHGEAGMEVPFRAES
jgi:hypothetical protein